MAWRIVCCSTLKSFSGLSALCTSALTSSQHLVLAAMRQIFSNMSRLHLLISSSLRMPSSIMPDLSCAACVSETMSMCLKRSRLASICIFLIRLFQSSWRSSDRPSTCISLNALNGAVGPVASTLTVKLPSTMLKPSSRTECKAPMMVSSLSSGNLALTVVIWLCACHPASPALYTARTTVSTLRSGSLSMIALTWSYARRPTSSPSDMTSQMNERTLESHNSICALSTSSG